ncbi:nitrous oxide reductase accessory protein NosL [Pseudomonas sp. GD04087]|uniref:nitrous oxide reductase accessory protein NosL n=1 Tax=Pseudomonas TaxID=286 RepID=UPI001F387A7E|nr:MULTISPECIES: nitrous oxide reductase accessory protein NosL [Pseudomonas]MDH0288700.1 nitrous oxide reductase accessory protein NosL [Pseudomonas sp. GD04087]MDH1050699.1 nitrous oxide reductase accessory protein NosL [Pseudomonas sp. GD03903]MDH1999124.1 nitrous oxide reductase accessory protein NosL [Pseudomonas sp. GD03691]
MLHFRSLRLGLAAGLLSLLLGGCDDAAQQNADLGPVPFKEGEECHVCGMVISDFAGPKGEAVAPGAVHKFCSTAELLGWWLQPENQHSGARLYVHDMARSDWNHPDDRHLIDATSAFYVVGVKRPGAMGATLASFSERADAERMANAEGGRVLGFSEIDQNVLQGVSGDHLHH